MDLDTLRTFVDDHDVRLLTLGTTEITVTSLVKLLVFGVLLWLIAGRFARWTLDKLLSRTHMDKGQRAAVTGLVHYTVLVGGAVLILQNAGIQLTAFAVVGSAMGVGIGFGLQNIISNFISGLIILLERPIQVGDRVELAGIEGVVDAIGARRTTIITPDRVAVLVPNQRFITDNVTNTLYRGHVLRLRVPVTTPAGSDVRELERLLLGAAQGPDIAPDPVPLVTITDMKQDEIALELTVWYDARTQSRRQLLSRLYFSISDAMKALAEKKAAAQARTAAEAKAAAQAPAPVEAKGPEGRDDASNDATGPGAGTVKRAW